MDQTLTEVLQWFDRFRAAMLQVAMAMTAKAKLLLRELNTVKADLAFAKERCGQLEEENIILRESSGKRRQYRR